MKLSSSAMKEITVALDQYRKVVEATNLTRTTKDTYLLHSENFVRWLEDGFEPGERKK
jgi:hypothetical protein